jgi:ABC-2 type transport system ATP-binding protein
MITIRNISMKYGATRALDDVSFAVNQGEVLGLLGPNGAGKSTLMKILTTYLFPTHGSATIGAFDIIHDPLKVRELVGYLPENVPLYTDMRVDEYLRFVGKARGVFGPYLMQRLQWVIDSCGISSVWKHLISELSKGYRQRVGLAQSLIHDPQVLILDEPTSGLDPVQIIGIRTLIKSLAKEKTIIFSTHILQEVEAIADRIVIINEGTIISCGTRAELTQTAMQYRVFVLTVKGLQRDVERALGGLSAAKDIRFVEAPEEGFVTFEIHVAFDDHEAWCEIDALNKKKQWPVRNFNERSFDLEDLFISLLTKTNREPVKVEG